MGYGYGYRDYGGFGGGANVRVGFILAAIVLVAGLIASIVFTVKGYRRYIKKPGTSWSGIFSSSGIGPFVRFDTLLIERVIAILYMFNAMMGVVMSLALWLVILVSDFVVGLVALIPIVLLTFLAELLMRLGYEGTMLRVIVARNTTEIKQSMGADAHGSGPVVSGTSSAPSPAPVFGGEAFRAPAAPAPARARRHAQPAQAAYEAPQPVQPSRPQPAQQQAQHAAEPASQADENVCPHCGAKLRPGVRFCANCGERVR